RQFDNLCKALLLEVLKDDIRFIDNSSRVTNRISLNVYLQNKIYEINATDCIELFLSLNVPAGIVKNMEEVFQNPLSESLILKENIEGTNTTKLKTAVFKIS
ncbi:MAG: crotonobetainyl-CoA:carnitine CoA-transferase CaiB-like acyl-CoA transferase, partial [Planctomycetota bacterium]